MEPLYNQQISQDLDSLEGILGYILGLGTLVFTGASVAFTVIASIISLLITVAYYLLQSIPLFIMARKAGFRHAWMAFFPYTNDFLTFMLPIREFNLFNWIKTNRRDIMALVYIGLSIAGFWAMGILAGLTVGVPIIGPWLSTFGGTIVIVSINMLKWRMYYDLFMTFAQKSNALWVSIVSLFIPWLFMLFTLFSCKNPPEYGAGNYDKYRNQD
jgi:hypothetical protein